MIRAGVLCAVAAVVAGCGYTTTAEVDNDSRLSDDSIVVYAFHDSSVPPQYHRSVALTASKDETRIVIDSYGDVLADVSVATPGSAWTRLAETIEAVSSLEVTNPAEGCTGGTAMDLTVSDGDVRIVDLAPEFCGGSNEGIEEAIADWIAPVRDLFAPTDELAPEGP